MNDLFEIPESLSPRLLWIKDYGIQIRKDEWDACEGKTRPFAAWSPGKGLEYGDTEDEALTQLALKLGIRLWNET